MGVITKLFGGFGKKGVSSGGYLVAPQNGGAAVFTPRRYDRFAEEGYSKNVVAFRAIDEIARNLAAVPLRLKLGVENVEFHEVLDLLKRPNPMQSGYEFRRAWAGYFLIGGNAFIEGVKASGDVGGVQELWLRRPDRMQVVAGVGGVPAGYVFREGGKARHFAVDPVRGAADILHSKSFHPLNEWYGMSAMEAAAVAIDQQNAANEWNTALLQNGAKPSGVLSSAEPLDEMQYDRLKGQLDEVFMGARNAGRPMLLEGGLAWQEMGFSPREMDFIEAKHVSARDIAQAFGVPSQLLGIPGDNTYANLQEARLHFWENTVMPLVTAFVEDLNHWLLPYWGDEALRIEADFDDVAGLAPKRAKRWEMVSGAGFLTVNEKRLALGYAPIEGGDVLGDVVKKGGGK